MNLWGKPVLCAVGSRVGGFSGEGSGRRWLEVRLVRVQGQRVGKWRPVRESRCLQVCREGWFRVYFAVLRVRGEGGRVPCVDV